VISEPEKIRELLPDEQAARLVELVFEACQLADDLVDRDKDINPSRTMCRLLLLCLVEIPSNGFYQQFSGFLTPVLMQGVVQWGASNELVHHEDTDVQRWAWAMRDTVEQIVTACAYLEGGPDAALEAAVDAGAYFRTNPDRESCEEWRRTMV
jgi:hypothetical protein